MPLVRKPSDGPRTEAREPIDVEAVLLHGSPDDRWTAVRALADAPAGLRTLTSALARETDPRVRNAIFTGLVRIATPESARAVLPYLRSDDADIRTEALDALHAMPEAAKPHLETLLHDPEADIRLLACEIARDLPVADAMPLLCALLQSDDASNVCAAAVDVLAEIGTPDARPALMHCASRFPDDPFLGFAIKIAIDRLRPQSSDVGA